uniref:Phosphatidate phosphatase APP1 catalytic domain-containing protein n=1 Tax=Chromera velia CCMP2878 TaxID=1169474 RepID=A0A0G4HYI7_9ALVE|eukprot:Cvel_9500.t1-p1 / transcript=Cvel_9500.t1 / gene=Cvel_9500 / organism=Chromera_velia_CCMP2878 / gene_product=hypothetical protein / transcript_product=hypothetical protein / location=Cvel_scaffold549:26964-28301(-) / protein_length=446 / sequence_SO=supercontig / SO=protein_coding / is_pseudo=false
MIPILDFDLFANETEHLAEEPEDLEDSETPVLDFSDEFEATSIPIVEGCAAQVFSDFDDTMVCTQIPVATVDRNCPGFDVFLGMKQFQYELSLTEQPKKGCDPLGMILLSARNAYNPDSATQLTVRNLPVIHRGGDIERWDDYPRAALLGSFYDAMGPLMRSGLRYRPDTWVNVGERKYKNLYSFFRHNGIDSEGGYWSGEERLPLLGDVRVIFVGDDGQGDVLACNKMLSSKLVDYCFIHTVAEANGMTPPFQPEEKERTVMFSDYMNAGVAAFDLGLISLEGLKRIKQSVLSHYFWQQKCVGLLSKGGIEDEEEIGGESEEKETKKKEGGSNKGQTDADRLLLMLAVNFYRADTPTGRVCRDLALGLSRADRRARSLRDPEGQGSPDEDGSDETKKKKKGGLSERKRRRRRLGWAKKGTKDLRRGSKKDRLKRYWSSGYSSSLQ